MNPESTTFSTKLTLFHKISILTFTIFTLYFGLSNVIVYVRYTPFAKEIQYKTLNNGNNMKIGILSDTHIGQPLKDFSGNTHHPDTRLLQALKRYSDHDIDWLLFAGDIVDSGSDYEYITLHKILDDYYKNKKRPVILFTPGNHEFHTFPGIRQFVHYKFEKYHKVKPFTHYLINGYHFIMWGNYLELEFPQISVNWVEQEIEKARKDTPNQPIFVITHFPPINTVYGSKGWGSKIVLDTLTKYEQVVCISGHSHYPAIDPNTWWQGDFTVINSQGTVYTEVEEKENNNYYLDEYDNFRSADGEYYGVWIDIVNGKNIIEVNRIEFNSGVLHKDPYYLDLPFSKDTFRYKGDQYSKKNTRPVFPEEAESTIRFKIESRNGKKYRHICFKQAKDEDYIMYYIVSFTNSKDSKLFFEYEYYSDFILWPYERKEILSLKLNNEVKAGEYVVEIVAVNAYRNKSNVISGFVVIG